MIPLMVREDQRGSIPLVLLASIIVAGLIVALFMDVSTGIRLSAADREYQQAVQIADAGIQAAFAELALLDESEFPDVGEQFETPRTGVLGGGEFAWNARRVGANTWEVRAEGEFGRHVRFMESRMGPATLFADAAFGDRLVLLRGANAADSYPLGGLGSVGSNRLVRLLGNATVDRVDLFGGAQYDGRLSNIRGEQPPVTSVDPRELPNIGLEAYGENGPCSAGPVDGSLTLPMIRGRTYCVTSATFPGRANHLLQSSGDPDQDQEPTRIFVAVGGDVHVQGQGANAAHVNRTPTDNQPDATALEIYLAGGGGNFYMNNHTSIAAGIYAPDSTCGGLNSNAQADVFGSIICAEIGNQGGWNFSYDERFSQVTAEFFTIHSLREEFDGTTSFGN